MRHIFIMGNTATKCYQYVEKNYDIALYYNHYARLIMEGILPLIVLIYCNLKLHMKVRNNLQELHDTIKSRQSPILEAFPLDPRPHGSIPSDEVQMRSRTNTEPNLSTKIRIISATIQYELAKASIAIVLVFVICQTPNLILRFCESIYLDANNQMLSYNGCESPPMYPLWILKLESTANFMLILNSSFNVVVYCWFDKKRRNTVKCWINKTVANCVCINASDGFKY